MGVYCKTLRGQTKVVDGIEIGKYVFAYKVASNLYRGCRDKTVNAMHAMADRMADKNQHIRHFINCDFVVATNTPVEIIRIDNPPDPDVIEGLEGEIIGYLVKRNGRFHIEQPCDLA